VERARAISFDGRDRFLYSSDHFGDCSKSFKTGSGWFFLVGIK
jgi:hypothetical protein